MEFGMSLRLALALAIALALATALRRLGVDTHRTRASQWRLINKVAQKLAENACSKIVFVYIWCGGALKSCRSDRFWWSLVSSFNAAFGVEKTKHNDREELRRQRRYATTRHLEQHMKHPPEIIIYSLCV